MFSRNCCVSEWQCPELKKQKRMHALYWILWWNHYYLAKNNTNPKKQEPLSIWLSLNSSWLFPFFYQLIFKYELLWVRYSRFPLSAPIFTFSDFCAVWEIWKSPRNWGIWCAHTPSTDIPTLIVDVEVSTLVPKSGSVHKWPVSQGHSVFHTNYGLLFFSFLQ